MKHYPYYNPSHYPCPYPYQGGQGMYGVPNMYLDMYEDRRRLMDMYPACYRRIYPQVQEMCRHMDVPTNPRMYPYVDPTMLEEMINQVYAMEMGEATSQQRGFLRDIITILFIRELLGRRRRYYNDYQYPGVGYPDTPGFPGGGFPGGGFPGVGNPGIGNPGIGPFI
ncbi:hypothetical protein [Alkaliphilus hydrothermalis]|uniref:Spore coat protein n=1 Tax=Alkaliphilus hydrothermalis TaxID=1482730 RepID=A0ABS2NP91_9FIRM|nr:hypothetical protein [Alkaliphilus hydrothermalis]MBM7614763.1 hypothetical protein [Alkaliphilus hydrothermalis]